MKEMWENDWFQRRVILTIAGALAAAVATLSMWLIFF